MTSRRSVTVTSTGGGRSTATPAGRWELTQSLPKSWVSSQSWSRRSTDLLTVDDAPLQLVEVVRDAEPELAPGLLAGPALRTAADEPDQRL